MALACFRTLERMVRRNMKFSSGMAVSFCLLMRVFLSNIVFRVLSTITLRLYVKNHIYKMEFRRIFLNNHLRVAFYFNRYCVLLFFP